MQGQRLIVGIGELLWDILPAPPQPDSDSPAASSAQPLPAGSPAGAVSPEEAMPIGLFGTLPIEPIAPAGLPAPPEPPPSRIALLGGAPANFTVMAGRLGNHAVVLSRIGRDDLGRMAVNQLDPLPVDASLLQIDTAQPTGRVTVKFVNGEPRYTIHEPAAWDFLVLSDQWLQLAERADAICFGSLAQRSEASRRTIQELVATAPARCVRVFDVNLRPPFYSSEVIQESLGLATVVKMNEEELPEVLRLVGLPGEEPESPASLRAGAERLLSEFPELQMAAITRGNRGSLLVTRQGWHDHPGFSVKVADAIGAGDAFTAAMTHYILSGAPLDRVNEAGNRWGSWMASQPGAMPAMSEAVREAVTAAIGE